MKIALAQINPTVGDLTGNEARILARIDFYRKDSRIVSNVRDEQLWWYDTTQKSWFLGTPMPDFAKAAQPSR